MPFSVLLLALVCSCSAPPAGAAQEGGAPPQEPATSLGPGPRVSAENLAGLALRSIGPALMSGRIADVALHPEDPSTWYVAVGSGGVWKTVNAGTTWTPLFDAQSSYSVGCLAIDPSRPDTIWVGTGENVGGRHVGYGDGVYKSLDGGQTWTNTGLKESEHIGRIVIDPRDSDVVYVAAQGPLWKAGGERGLYKTTDGGATWACVLSAGPYTGVNDVVIDPRDPDVLIAATHQRYRNVAALIDGGPESGIHKSTDGGATWRELRRGLPSRAPGDEPEEEGAGELDRAAEEDTGGDTPEQTAEDMGRIGLALSPQDPDVVYATIELAQRKGGFYRSLDGGESWEKRSDYLSGGTGPHYYQEIWADPHHPDTVYQADVWLHVTEDGGKTFRPVGEENKHSDNHALAFHPDDPDYLLAGCDGGLYETFDRGATWKFVANLPVTQFYKVALDDAEPFYNVYGGTQDNNTQGGPSRTDSLNGIRNADWFITLFGDGHQPATEPGNPHVVYSEWQEGNLVRTDRRSGEIVYIQPQPAQDEPWERFNWDAPILVSPHAATRLYYASQRVWRSDDRGDSWTPISGDLSRGIDRLRQPMMDARVWSVDAVWDLWAMSKYGTVTSLAESPLVEGLLYAGTDDGRIQVSEDGGASWRAVESLPGVEPFFFVNDLKADLFDADTVYACVDQHKSGDFAPYLFKSGDRGRSWTSLAGDLPERHLVWRLVQDHERPELLFLGTEFGLFVTLDGGSRWVRMQGGMPTIPVRDLAVQRREDDLVCATFGRGFYVLDDYSPLRAIDEAALESEALLLPLRDAHWYLPRATLGSSLKASQGDASFAAENPPFGAVFTYWLRDEPKTEKAARREREQELAQAGADTPTPGWDALREEEREEDPAVVLTVSNAAGEVVRRLTGPAKAGLQRIAWDLRLPSVAPWDPEPRTEEWDPNRDSGLLAAPGTYRVRMALRLAGALRDLGEERSFEVVPLQRGGLPGASPAEVAAFQAEIDAARRRVQSAGAALEELGTRLRAMREVLGRSAVPDASLDDAVRALERRALDLRERLDGNERRDNAGDPGPVSIARRVDVAFSGNRYSTYGPTPTHRESLAIGLRGLAELARELDGILRVELPGIEARLDEAGVPWTPGRSVAPVPPGGDR